MEKEFLLKKINFQVSIHLTSEKKTITSICNLGFLSIYSVDSFDDGDYICIASNAFGRSFSSKRSLIVSGKIRCFVACIQILI